MSLTLEREGGIAKPLKKRTVGQTNIAHVYDGANHIWPTSVIYFSDFTSVQLRYIWGSHGGGFVHGNGYCWYENKPNDKYKVWNNQVNTTGTLLTLDKPTLNITSDDNYSYEYHTVLLNEDNTVYNDNYTDNYKFRFGFVAGNSEFRGQQTIQCYVGTQGGKADDGKTSIGEIKYTKLNKIGELTIYSPIES